MPRTQRICTLKRNSQISYEGLIEFGRRVAKEVGSSKNIGLISEAMWEALRARSQEFWKNWSIVTGIPLPPSLKDKGFHHWSCCPWENHYWFGSPDSSDPAE